MSAGATKEERDLACRSCITCEGRVPGTASPSSFSEEDAAIIEQVERLAAERNAGRQLKLGELDPLLWELLVIYDAQVREHERFLRVKMAAVYDGLVQLFGAKDSG